MTTSLRIENNAITSNNSQIFMNFTGSIPNNIVDTGIIESTSTGTGALVVYGGIGVGGNTNIGGTLLGSNLEISSATIPSLININSNITIATIPTLLNNNSIITTATNPNLLSINSVLLNSTNSTLLSTDSSIASLTTTGLNIQNNEITSKNLQTFMNFTTSTTNNLIDTGTIESYSTGTGSLVVYGGLGVGGNINAGGNSIISNATIPQLTIGNLTGTPFPSMLTITATGTGTYNLYYSFTINTGTAVVNDTYTNNSITYTVFQSVTSSRSVIMTGSGPPTSSGTLTRATGTGDPLITFTNVWTPKYLDVQVQGAGGGGGGSGTVAGNGLQGGLSSFGTNSTVLLLAGGGLGGQGATPGPSRQGATGGTVSSTLQTNVTLINGGNGQNGHAHQLSGATVSRGVGGNGGSSYFGGAGVGSQGSGFPGTAGFAGGGGGGGGADQDVAYFAGAAGGGAGGYIRAIIKNPVSSYPYTVGTGGTAGTASGTNSSAGLAGGPGQIIVISYYT